MVYWNQCNFVNLQCKVIFNIIKWSLHNIDTSAWYYNLSIHCVIRLQIITVFAVLVMVLHINGDKMFFEYH